MSISFFYKNIDAYSRMISKTFSSFNQPGNFLFFCIAMDIRAIYYIECLKQDFQVFTVTMLSGYPGFKPGIDTVNVLLDGHG